MQYGVTIAFPVALAHMSVTWRSLSAIYRREFGMSRRSYSWEREDNWRNRRDDDNRRHRHHHHHHDDDNRRHCHRRHDDDD